MKKLTVVAMMLLLSSCAKVKVIDMEVCGDLGPFGAHCSHTLTPDKRDISVEDWDKMRFGRLSFTSEDFTNMMTSIDSLCANSNKCDYQTKQNIEMLRNSMNDINERANYFRSQIR